MDAQVPELSNLPPEVLGIICRPLSLKDRVCFSSTCRTLLRSLASSQDAWGALEIREAAEKMPFLAPWLARRRQGLRRLELDFSPAWRGGVPQPVAQLATALLPCLEGSPLVQLHLSDLQLSAEEYSAELQWLGSCTTLTSLALNLCGLRCLPGALERLPALAELSLHWSMEQGASWGRLQQLTALTRLDISWCELAAVPAELAALPALAALDLHWNTGLGAAAEEAWAPLAQCSRLASLGIGCIPFARLPLALAALAPHLVALDLAVAGQEGLWTGGEATLGPLLRLTGLTRLTLQNSLQSSALPLPQELSCLVELRDLDLSENDGLEEGLALCALRHLTALTRLNLHSCSLADLPEELSHLQALQDLDFGRQMQDVAITRSSWQRLCRLTALTRLVLGSCNLERLPPELAELRSLAELNLSSNGILGGRGDESAAVVATNWTVLENLTALTCLDASYCRLHAVPAALAALPGLRVLHLKGNPSLGRGGVEALRPLASMTALQHLDLLRCCLPRELETDAIPFPLHRLEGWADRVKDVPDEEISWRLRLS